MRGSQLRVVCDSSAATLPLHGTRQSVFACHSRNVRWQGSQWKTDCSSMTTLGVQPILSRYEVERVVISQVTRKVFWISGLRQGLGCV